MKKLIDKMNALAKSNKLEVAVATSMLVVTSDRIFDKGKDAAGADIGTYSPGYLKQRVRRGYPNSKKVILQATRQMVNDFSVISTGADLGLGFKNSANADKSEWVEATYGKAIFKHTSGELKILDDLIAKELKKALS